MILPVEIRRALNLKKGDRVIIDAEGDRIALTSVQRERNRAKAMFRKFVAAGENVVDELVDERRAEARREDQEASTTANRPARSRKS